jgi:hypothetical protein
MASKIKTSSQFGDSAIRGRLASAGLCHRAIPILSTVSNMDNLCSAFTAAICTKHHKSGGALQWPIGLYYRGNFGFKSKRSRFPF